MEEFLIKLSTDHVFWVYIIIVFTVCVQGPLLALIFGALIKLGYFPFFPIYLALILGDLFGDAAWYIIGRDFGHPFVRKYGKYVSISEERIHIVKDIYHKYKNWILIISKLTTGFGFAIVILFTAGLARIPFRHYMLINFIGQFIWTALLIGVGYFFSELYLEVDHFLGRMSIIALFIILIGAFLGFSRYVKKRLTGK